MMLIGSLDGCTAICVGWTFIIAAAVIRIRVLFFASLADLMGKRQMHIVMPAGSKVADAVTYFERDTPGFAAYISHVSVAVNEAFVTQDVVLADGDELAMIPPVSGG